MDNYHAYSQDYHDNLLRQECEPEWSRTEAFEKESRHPLRQCRCKRHINQHLLYIFSNGRLREQATHGYHSIVGIG
jgi:hypothetical protein